MCGCVCVNSLIFYRCTITLLAMGNGFYFFLASPFAFHFFSWLFVLAGTSSVILTTSAGGG